MALSGMHVVFGYAGSNQGRESGALLLKPMSSETLATASTTTKTAPASSASYGQPMVQIVASVDAWAAAGPAPDASVNTGPRVFCPAGETVEFFVDPGDKIDYEVA